MGFETFDSNLAVRKHIESLGYAQKGAVITPDDYQAIAARTKILMKEAHGHGAILTEEDAVSMAYFDRMMVQGQIGIDDIIDTIEPEEFRELLSTYSGHPYTTEESEAFIRYLRSHAERGGAVLTELVENWIQERAAATKDVSDLAVVDESDTVHGTGNDHRDLMRRAREE